MSQDKPTRFLNIPEIFFKEILAARKLYSRIWFYWMSEFVDEIFEPDFLEKQKNLTKWVTESEIKEIHEFGVQLLQQNGFKIIEVKGKKKRANKPLSSEIKKSAVAAIEYLNAQAGTTFSPKGNNLDLVASRLTEGYSLAEIKLVIDKKVQDWKGSDYSKYLRPMTLFNKTKFENYLNGTNEQQQSGKISKLSESVAKAQQLIEFYTKS